MNKKQDAELRLIIKCETLSCTKQTKAGQRRGKALKGEVHLSTLVFQSSQIHFPTKKPDYFKFIDISKYRTHTHTHTPSAHT